MPSLTFTCKAAKEENKLEVTVLSCEGLPDLDGAFNLTDPYVVVKVGKEKQMTKAVGGSLNPRFDKETSTFLFDKGSAYGHAFADVPSNARIFFQVMDKDTLSYDDVIGKTSIKLSKAEALKGEPKQLDLVGRSSNATSLSKGQVTAIFRLFATVDRENTGKIASSLARKLASSGSLDENNSGYVSFAHFLGHFKTERVLGQFEETLDSEEEMKKWIAGKEKLLKA